MVNGGDKTAVKGESISKNRAAAAFYNGNSRVKGRSELVKIRDKNSWTVVDALFIPISIPRGGGGRVRPFIRRGIRAPSSNFDNHLRRFETETHSHRFPCQFARGSRDDDSSKIPDS